MPFKHLDPATQALLEGAFEDVGSHSQTMSAIPLCAKQTQLCK